MSSVSTLPLPASARPTPSVSGIPLNSANFETLAHALDYAATGDSGFNYYDGRDRLVAVLPYSELRRRAVELARHIAPLGRGGRLAIVAHTHPDFAVMFYACQYAGLVPVPLPAAVHLGGREAYVRHLHLLLLHCDAVAAFAPEEFLGFLHEASAGVPLKVVGSLDGFLELPVSKMAPQPSAPQDLAYLQYTSGSTRFPRGTMITQAAVMENLHAIFNHGFELTTEDRFCSWLPHYHDMGLVGIVLGCMVTQRTCDYLPTREFAMRPRLWLKLISRNRSTISFSPPFGYTLCARRLRPADLAALDLRSWRIAGVGAEMIHLESLRHVAEVFAPAGFAETAFLPCYGMAECALAVSFSPVGLGARTDTVDIERLSRHDEAIEFGEDGSDHPAKGKTFVDCGRPLPGYEVEIRDRHGRPCPDRRSGTVFLRGPSVMSGYFNNPQATSTALSADGWLDTGDLAYRADGSLFLIGRAKDVMIIKGRNIWPQDLEYLAEQQPEVRSSDASAFTIEDADNGELAVLVVQARETDPLRLSALVERLKHAIQTEFGIQCLIELVPPHTLPRTSSGKLSRSKTRLDFLARHREDRSAWPASIIHTARAEPSPETKTTAV